MEPRKPGATDKYVRVLVVDDFKPFRRFVCSVLRNQPEFQIVGEASDGLEAVQKVQELQPDLILLDIGLPKLSGIKAAWRIRELSPKSKILFASASRFLDIIEEALRTGASGYLVKSDVGSELLPALEAVLQGRQFVSAGLTGHDVSNLRNKHTAQHRITVPTQNVEVRRHHQIAFYSDDAALVDGFAHFIEAALKIGHAVVVITTESHRASILRRLQSGGLDPAVDPERFVLLNVADSLSTLMADVSGGPVQFARGVNYPLIEAVNAATEKDLHVAVG